MIIRWLFDGLWLIDQITEVLILTNGNCVSKWHCWWKKKVVENWQFIMATLLNDSQSRYIVHDRDHWWLIMASSVGIDGYEHGIEWQISAPWY